MATVVQHVGPMIKADDATLERLMITWADANYPACPMGTSQVREVSIAVENRRAVVTVWANEEHFDGEWDIMSHYETRVAARIAALAE